MAEAPRIVHYHVLGEGDIPPEISELFSLDDDKFQPIIVSDAPGDTRIADIIAQSALTGSNRFNTRYIKNLRHRAESFVINFETQDWALVIVRRICCACNAKSESNMTFKCSGCDKHGYCSAECRRNDAARHQKSCSVSRDSVTRELK